MTTAIYIAAILFTLGLFIWLFGSSKLRALQNSFVPATVRKIRTFQCVTWVGVAMLAAGLILGIVTAFV